MITLKEPLEFDWDEGNIEKNKKHNVSYFEAEQSFFDSSKVIIEDDKHSVTESRQFDRYPIY